MYRSSLFLKGIQAMKIKGQKYEVMKNAMKSVVEHLGGANAVKKMAENKQKSLSLLLWNLWSHASDQLKYDDNHPHFKSGLWTRIIPQNPDFSVYSDDTNDSHIESAIKKIGKELGII